MDERSGGFVTNKVLEEKFVKMSVGEIDIYTFPMKVKYLVKISYVAVRGRDKEEGAVQRVLNKKRIASIKQYVLDGNMFVNTFVINWNDVNYAPKIDAKNGKILIPLIDSVAQLIDGQHRLEGLKEAVKIDENIEDKMLLVSMVIGLKTKEAAKIFININSEQKPVPKSLIFDLYGVTEDDKNFAITRSGDIAKALNEDIESPYYNLIKYPGSPRGKGKIDLSTVVSSLKKYVDVDGKFVENNIRDLNLQSQCIINYFAAIRFHWDKEDLWGNASKNVFFKASGFIAAIEFFFEYIFPKCVEKKSFKLEYLISLFDFAETTLITNNDIKGSDGKSARKMIIDNLKEGLITEAPQEDEYEY